MLAQVVSPIGSFPSSAPALKCGHCDGAPELLRRAEPAQRLPRSGRLRSRRLVPHRAYDTGFYQRSPFRTEAIAVFQKLLEASSSGGSSITKANLAHAYAVSGNREAAQKIITELEEQSKSKYVAAFDIALIHAGLGEKDQAFAWLEKAYEERSPDLVTLRTEPRFDNLRSDRRFTDLAGRVGLSPRNSSSGTR